MNNIDIYGIVENIIYYNNENLYTVFSIFCEEEIEEIICVGYIPNLKEGENLKLFGKYIIHPTYGKQLSIDKYERLIPTTKDAIKKYLSSGVIKGIGDVLAKRIVDKFGDKTFEIIEKDPEKLSMVKGVSIEKAKIINIIFNEEIELRKIIILLQNYNISANYAIKIYKKYKSDTINIIEKNPYILSDDIFGIGFKIADKIAFEIGIDRNSNYRVKSGIKYCLNNFATKGNVCIPKYTLIEDTKNLLDVDESIIENNMIDMQIEKSIVQDKIKDETFIYLSSFYNMENYIAKKILELSSKLEIENISIEEKIKKVEKKYKITLDEYQRKAVEESLTNKTLIITGGPGTGKTITINVIISILLDEGYDIELAAPTGRAAKRMSEATKISAKTIHRLLEIKFLSDGSNKQNFEKDENNTIEADVIIIDEISMIDMVLMFNLLKAIEDTTRLILVGDIDQLPSIGAGNILKDIINSNLIKTIYLKEVFRQGQESAIVVNAHRINKGKYPVLNNNYKDFFIINRNNPTDIINTILELILERIPNYLNCKREDIQVITPMRKSQVGVENLNKILQEKINPKSKNKAEYNYRKITFREGDKVMQIKNNYNMPWIIYNKKGIQIDEGIGIFNGDEGIIKKIVDYKETLEIEFYDGKIVNYDFTQLDELDLSYAITIHKSQGSEYRVIIIPIYSSNIMLLSRNLLYTAVTRGKELVIIVGMKEILCKMIDNNKEINRYSFLDYRMKSINKFLN